MAALAETDSRRLAAIQPELVGALHAAADAEVMKAAAENRRGTCGDILNFVPMDRVQ
ncbi:MAG: hypothetical protein R6X02_20650 [Enhygromyxa sp.]